MLLGLFLIFTLLLTVVCYLSPSLHLQTRTSAHHKRLQLSCQQQDSKELPSSTPLTYTDISLAVTTVAQLNIFDIPEIISLSKQEFVCKTLTDFLYLSFEISRLFFPKLLLPAEMGHAVLGIKKESSGELIAMVDLSLQPSNGTMDALTPRSLDERITMYVMRNIIIRPILPILIFLAIC